MPPPPLRGRTLLDRLVAQHEAACPGCIGLAPITVARMQLQSDHGRCWGRALALLRANYPPSVAREAWIALLEEPGSGWANPDGSPGLYCVPGYSALCGDVFFPDCELPPQVLAAGGAAVPSSLATWKAALLAGQQLHPELGIVGVGFGRSPRGSETLEVRVRENTPLVRSVFRRLAQVVPLHVVAVGTIRAQPAGVADDTDAWTTYLVRQGARWWYAGQQDQDPVVRFLHLAYAHGYLETAHRLAGPTRASQRGGIDTTVLLEDTAAKLDATQRLLIQERGGLPPQLHPLPTP